MIKEQEKPRDSSTDSCGRRSCDKDWEALERRWRAIERAFLNNDLGEKDYEGHRLDHLTRQKEQRLIESYKHDLTGKILWALVGGAGLLLAAMGTSWIRDAIRTIMK